MIETQQVRQCYLALPIQGTHSSNAIYRQLASSIIECGVDIINPEVIDPPPKDLEERFAAAVILRDNLNSLSKVDFLIAELSTPSLGIGYEIAQAEHAGIPVIGVFQYRNRSLSKMISGNNNPLVNIFEYSHISDLPGIIRLALKWLQFLQLRMQDDRTFRERLAAHFAQLAPEYNETTEWRRHPKILQWFEKNIGDRDINLDMGSGTGIIAQTVAEVRGITIRLDLSEMMLRHSRVGLPVVADAEQVPIQTGVIDNVMIRQLMQYVDAARVLGEVRRVLRPGGQLLLGQVVAPDDRIARWWRQLRRVTQPLQRYVYTFPHMINMVLEAGFQIVRSDRLVLNRTDSWDTFVINAGDGDSVAMVREYIAQVPPDIQRHMRLIASDDKVIYHQHWGLLQCRI